MSTYGFALVAAFLLLPSAVTAPASAQLIPNSQSAQAVGLFIQTCIPFSEDASGLRKWATDRQLSRLSGELATAFLGDVGKGQAFSASNSTGRYVLLSYDNGTCRVVAEQGDMQVAEGVLLAYLSTHGFAVTPSRSEQRSGAAQKIYIVTARDRHWTLSVTQHDHSDAPSVQPQLDLLATP
jgi:hypothetical protein